MKINIWMLEPFEYPSRQLEHYRRLRESIRLSGIMNPIEVILRPSGLYRVLNGRWRVIAARSIGLYELNVYVYPEWSDNGIHMDLGDRALRAE